MCDCWPNSPDPSGLTKVKVVQPWNSSASGEGFARTRLVVYVLLHVGSAGRRSRWVLKSGVSRSAWGQRHRRWGGRD